LEGIFKQKKTIKCKKITNNLDRKEFFGKKKGDQQVVAFFIFEAIAT